MFQLKTARIGAVHMESRYTKLRKKGIVSQFLCRRSYVLATIFMAPILVQ